MLLDTECFPYSFKMCLAFPRNHINNRGDNILSIPYGLSDCFFLFIKYWFCGGLGFRKHLQNVSCVLHRGCGGSAGLSCWRFERRERMLRMS